MPAVLGIDFGATATKAAMVCAGRVELVMEQGRADLPSSVWVPERGDLQPVRAGERVDPGRVISLIKRLLGRSWGDPEVRAVDAAVGYRLAPAADGGVTVIAGGQECSPVQIVAALLRHVRALAEQRTGRPFDRVLVSVPVSTAPGYAAALRRAAQLAGLGDIGLVAEPTAALAGAGLAGARRTVLVCDFGGSSFDCAVTVPGPQGTAVAAAGGDGFLGGADFDLALADALAGQVFRATRSDLRNDVLGWTELVGRCEEAKRRLSAAPRVRLEMPDALTHGGARVGLGINLERAAVAPVWQALVERAVQVAARVVDDAGVPAALLDDLVLVGGTNLIPSVRAAFVRRLGRQPSAVVASDVAVAAGLAQLAARAA